MVAGPIAADHRDMTTEQPTAPRLLRRRGDDRVLGGVASGLADYFNVDPLLVRIGFVGRRLFYEHLAPLRFQERADVFHDAVAHVCLRPGA